LASVEQIQVLAEEELAGLPEVSRIVLIADKR
jgi:hypothetical protein